MADVKYINGVGKNNQYNFRYFDNITDPTLNNNDFLVSPDEIVWYYKDSTINTTVKMTLLGQDNLLVDMVGEGLTSNTTIIE